ncbi:MAG TPA: hypothetical protein VEA69_12370, partial [Tepidisphaeraceae bacterium]|nr:hypothetical protein [Tepidisphaeraceae bacterium]
HAYGTGYADAMCRVAKMLPAWAFGKREGNATERGNREALEYVIATADALPRTADGVPIVPGMKLYPAAALADMTDDELRKLAESVPEADRKALDAKLGPDFIKRLMQKGRE